MFFICTFLPSKWYVPSVELPTSNFIIPHRVQSWESLHIQVIFIHVHGVFMVLFLKQLHPMRRWVVAPALKKASETALLQIDTGPSCTVPPKLDGHWMVSFQYCRAAWAVDLSVPIHPHPPNDPRGPHAWKPPRVLAADALFRLCRIRQ